MLARKQRITDSDGPPVNLHPGRRGPPGCYPGSRNWTARAGGLELESWWLRASLSARSRRLRYCQSDAAWALGGGAVTLELRVRCRIYLCRRVGCGPEDGIEYLQGDHSICRRAIS